MLPFVLAQISSEPVGPLPAPCPTASEVRAYVEDTSVREAPLEIEDRGTSFALKAAGQWRVVEEPAHDCAARAKIAAVTFIAMVAPPFTSELPAAAPAPPPSAPPPKPASPPAVRPRPLHWLFALGPTLEVAPGTDRRAALTMAGMSARAGATSARFGATVGATLFAPGELAVDTTRATLWRATVDASGHIQHTAGPFVLRASLGPALEIRDIRGTSADARGAFGASGAIRLGLDAAWAFHRSWHLSLGVSALFVPMPAELALHSVGVIGREPSAYLGTAARIWSFR